MSGSRPSWRSGLPYGWWKSKDALAFGCSCLALIVGAMILLAWFNLAFSN